MQDLKKEDISQPSYSSVLISSRNVLVEFEKEEKFRKGMAEIELLDKQLGKLNRKARDIKVETTELEMLSVGNIDDTFVTRLVTPGGKSVPSSTKSTPSRRFRTPHYSLTMS